MKIDLDALLPEGLTITFQGLDIDVKPPTLAQVMRLGVMGEKMQQPGILTDEQLRQFEQDMINLLGECIPELKGKELTSKQQMFLMTRLVEMSTPPDQEELEKRGITVDGPKAP